MSQTNRKWQCVSTFPFWKRKSLKKHFNRLWAFLQSTRGHERKLEWRINSKRVDHGGTKQFSKQQPTRCVNVRQTGDVSDKQCEFKRMTRTRERKWARNNKILTWRKPAMFFSWLTFSCSFFAEASFYPATTMTNIGAAPNGTTNLVWFNNMVKTMKLISKRWCAAVQSWKTESNPPKAILKSWKFHS